MLLLVCFLSALVFPYSDGQATTSFADSLAQAQAVCTTRYQSQPLLPTWTLNVTVSADNCSVTCVRTTRNSWQSQRFAMNDGQSCGENKECCNGNCESIEYLKLCKDIVGPKVLKGMFLGFGCTISCDTDEGTLTRPALTGTACQGLNKKYKKVWIVNRYHDIPDFSWDSGLCNGNGVCEYNGQSLNTYDYGNTDDEDEFDYVEDY